MTRCDETCPDCGQLEMTGCRCSAWEPSKTAEETAAAWREIMDTPDYKATMATDPQAADLYQEVQTGDISGERVAGGYKFTIKDSGARQDFSSGMVRDTEDEKVDYTLIFNGPMADRWAAQLTEGAVKYPDLPDGTPNWMLAAGQEEMQRFRRSAARHFRQWLRGEVDEDHAAALLFNINGYEYVKLNLPKTSVLADN